MLWLRNRIILECDHGITLLLGKMTVQVAQLMSRHVTVKAGGPAGARLTHGLEHVAHRQLMTKRLREKLGSHTQAAAKPSLNPEDLVTSSS